MIRRFVVMLTMLMGFVPILQAESWEDMNEAIAQETADYWFAKNIAYRNKSDLGLRAAYARRALGFWAFLGCYEAALKHKEGALPITPEDTPHIIASLAAYHSYIQEMVQVLGGEQTNRDGLFNLTHADLDFYTQDRFAGIITEQRILPGKEEGTFIFTQDLVQWAGLVRAGFEQQQLRAVVTTHPLKLQATQQPTWIGHMQKLEKQKSVCLQFAFLFMPPPVAPAPDDIGAVLGAMLEDETGDIDLIKQAEIKPLQHLMLSAGQEDVKPGKYSEAVSAVVDAAALTESERAEHFRLALTTYGDLCGQIAASMVKLRHFTPNGIEFNGGAIAPMAVWKAVVNGVFGMRLQSFCKPKHDLSTLSYNELVHATVALHTETKVTEGGDREATLSIKQFDVKPYLARRLEEVMEQKWDPTVPVTVRQIYARIALEEVFRFLAWKFKDETFLDKEVPLHVEAAKEEDLPAEGAGKGEQKE